MIGTTLAHYRITAALGAGGMGEVWRAEDTKLGRDVALKVLSEEFADNADRLERFEREARAVAALNHPHIVTIYSVEEANGIRFLTMELIEGQSLDKMIPDGGLELGPFLDLAVPLAEAISAAHDKSVIHRDLKPTNVMVDGDGRVKVLDFGLAKLQETNDPSDSSELPTEALTGVGMIVGTVPYMSPEQIESKIVDHRTDIFSLGVLLYEMATGERPFQGTSSPALMSSILKDVPQSVVGMREDLPRHLGRVIGRCLEKDRRDRYQTARDIFNELKALRRESSAAGSSVTPLPGIESAVSRTARPSSDASATASTRRDEGFWIAVLPFQARATESAVDALAEGLTEDIVTGLSRFSYLRVISRSSTSLYAGEGHDVRAVGEEFGARYVMEGSVRQAGAVLRVSVQLVDAESGAHLWAETYNRPFSPEEIFDLQDDLAPRIVSTVADMNGVLPHTMSETIRGRPVDQLSPYEAMLRGFGYYVQLTAEDHLEGRASLEKAVAEDPGNADCWALLSMMYAEEHKHGFNAKPDPLDRALTAARKAVAISPSNHFAHHVLAQAHFFRREIPAFRIAAERAIALNPMDGCTTAFMGILMAYAGQWDEGCALAERAMELNPHHPGWYRFSAFLNAYRKKDYGGALDVALKINMPTYYFTHASLAAVYGQLGDREAARQAVRELLAQKPDFGDTASEEWGRWTGPGELLDHLIDGLRRAGLNAAKAGGDTKELKSTDVASAAEVPGSVAIAVLPFSDLSPDKDQDYFCEGMAEEIMNALVHVDGIRVASRTSAFKAVEHGEDLQTVGRTLSVGTVLEGSVRLAGNRLRVTAQLTDVENGYQLWSERFDRDAEDVFAVQDEIAAGVVEAVTSRLTPGERKLRERQQVGNLEAYRHYLKGRHYRYTKNDHAKALESYEEAIALDPNHGPSWIGRAEVRVLATVYSLIPSHEAFATSKEELDQARRLQGESAEGCFVEGMIAFCETRWQDSEKALLRAIELRPKFVEALCWHGFLLSVQQRREEAEVLFEKARELDPLAAFPYGMTASGLLAMGRAREAGEFGDQGLQFDGENSLVLWCSGIGKVAGGRFDEGLAALEAAVQHSRRGGYILGVYGWGLAAAGRRQEAEAVLEELKSRPQPAPAIVSEAWILAALGDTEGAWKILERAEEEHQGILYFTGMPGYELLRTDPRWGALLNRLGLPPSPGDSKASMGSGAAESTSAGFAVRGPRPFVGRGDERAALDRMLDEAISGRGGLVLLGGEPGVGKTRLATEILEDGRERGMLALAGHAYEDETSPFVTASEILEEMVRLVPADDLRRMLGDNASEISRLLPELRQHFSDIPEPTDIPPELLQRHLFKNVLEFLTRASTDQPMVMLLDDIHWADESSLLLLEHIAPRLAELPILMVGTHRDVQADIGKPFARSMATLVRQRLAERIHIDPFDETSVAEVLAMLGGSAPPADLAHAIHDATEGNVFFIEETFRHLSEEGLLFDEKSEWQTEIDVENLDVPEGVRLVTARRLDRLTESTHTVLSLASVIGLRFPISVLEVASRDGDAVLDAVEEAEAAQLLKPATGGRELRYEFVHALARQTLLSELSPLRQQRMHLEIADAIEETGAGKIERRAADLAHHLVEAGGSADRERTVRWLTSAGENAVAAAAMEEAVQYFNMALSLIGDDGAEVRADLLHRRGSARLSLGHREGFLSDLNEAFDRFESLGLDEKAAAVVSELSYMLIWNGQSLEAKALTGRALAFVGDGQTARRSRLLSAQGLAHGLAQEPADAERAHEAAVRMARSLDDPALLAEVLQNQSIDGWFRLNGKLMERTGHEAASIRRDLHHEWNLGQCLWMEQAGLVWQGRFDEAQRINEELHPLAERNEDVGSLACSALMNSVIEQARGNLGESSGHMRLSIELFNAGNFPWGYMSEGHYSANALLAGEFDNARTAFELAGDNALPGVVWSGCDTCYWLSGRARLGDPDVLEIYESLRSQLPVAGQAMRSGALQLLFGSIEALMLIGAAEEAAKLYPAIRDFVTSGSGVVAFTYGLHERFAGMAAAAGRDWKVAEGHFEKALKLAEDLPHRVDQARVRYWYARMLLDRNQPGDSERAQQMLADARGLSVKMGLGGLVEQIDGLAGQSEVRDVVSVSEDIDSKSIAVLPFTNMSPDSDIDYFSDGLSEEIINALTRLPGLRVIARSSAFRFRGEQDLRTVGETLGVRNVLEGSVRRAGQQLRITAQLIDVADDSHIWSERFDREMTDVFEIQDEIARAIVKKLNVSLGASEPARRQTANVAAYDALLEGRHHFSQFTPKATERALVCFRRALSLDPDYPDALAYYAFYHLTMAYMFENPREVLPNTRELAERALQLDPHHGEAQAAVAVVTVMFDRDWSAGELLFHRALELAPASARVHELYGLCCLLGRGRYDEALAELDLAISLDPLSALYAGNRGRVLTCSRRFAEARESCRRGLALDSRQLLVQVELTYALLFDGRFEEAIAVGKRAIETHGPVNAPRQALALSHALAGQRDEAFELVNETAEPGAGYRSPLALGLVHAAFSEMDEAFACVERSFEERDPLLMYIAVHPMFDNLRTDSRYPDLLKRMNLGDGETT